MRFKTCDCFKFSARVNFWQWSFKAARRIGRKRFEFSRALGAHFRHFSNVNKVTHFSLLTQEYMAASPPKLSHALKQFASCAGWINVWCSAEILLRCTFLRSISDFGSPLAHSDSQSKWADQNWPK